MALKNHKASADHILFGVEKPKTTSLTWNSTMTDVSDKMGATVSHRSDNIQAPYKNRHTANGHVIHFVHIPTSDTCHFKAFLTQYEDKYTSTWKEEDVYGRMDPISTFARTGRKISLGWDVPSASEEEAILNLYEAERLLSMMYPVYEEVNLAAKSINNVKAAADRTKEESLKQFGEENSNMTADQAINIEQKINDQMLASIEDINRNSRTASTMVAPPLFKVKFANLIMSSDSSGYTADAAKAGLVCTIADLSYAPDIESGFFGGGPDSFVTPGALVPQTLKFSCVLTVHHLHGLGYQQSTRKKREESFPHRGRGYK